MYTLVLAKHTIATLKKLQIYSNFLRIQNDPFNHKLHETVYISVDCSTVIVMGRVKGPCDFSCPYLFMQGTLTRYFIFTSDTCVHLALALTLPLLQMQYFRTLAC